MAIIFSGVADFDLRPEPARPYLVGIWDAYEINKLDYWNRGVEIADWCRANCGEYVTDWWAYQVSDRHYAVFYFKPKQSVLFKLTWIGT